MNLKELKKVQSLQIDIRPVRDVTPLMNIEHRIKKSSKLANSLGIEVHAGHGLDYNTTKLLSKIKEIYEYNIGHFIIGESVFHGLSQVIKNFKKLLK